MCSAFSGSEKYYISTLRANFIFQKYFDRELWWSPIMAWQAHPHIFDIIGTSDIDHIVVCMVFSTPRDPAHLHSYQYSSVKQVQSCRTKKIQIFSQIKFENLDEQKNLFVIFFSESDWNNWSDIQTVTSYIDWTVTNGFSFSSDSSSCWGGRLHWKCEDLLCSTQKKSHTVVLC